MKNLIIFLVLIVDFSVVSAQQTVKVSHNQLIEAGTMIEWKSSATPLHWSPSPILSDSGWQRGKTNIINFGGLKDHVYGKIDGISSNGDSTYLIIDNINIDSVSIFYMHSKGIQKRIKSIPFDELALASRAYVFKIPDPKGKTVLMHFKSRNSLVLPILLSDERGYLQFIKRKQLSESILLGSTLVLILFNLMFLLWSKERNHLYYLIYTSFIIIFSYFYLRGFAIYLPLSMYRIITEYAYAIGGCTNFFAVLFSRRFLKPYPNLRWVNTFLNLYVAYTILVILLNLFGFRETSRVMIQSLGLLTPTIIIITALYPSRLGNRPAIIFLSGWLVAGTGVTIYSMSITGVLHFSWFTMALLPISTALIDLLILTSAMATRYAQLLKEKDALNLTLVNSLNYQKKELEQQVAERTFSLKQSNELLSESNDVKNRMISLITHDLKMPIVNLQAILDLLTGNLLTIEQSQRKLNDVKQSMGAILGILENLLLWSKQQQKSIQTYKSAVHLPSITDHTREFLRLPLESKQMELVVSLEQDNVWADQFQLETIFRNLLSNAILYAEAGSRIRIGQQLTDGVCCLFVENEGMTLTKERFDTILLGSNVFRTDINRLHTGIGLQLCQEFLRNHDSELLFESTPEFTRFYFLLKTS